MDIFIEGGLGPVHNTAHSTTYFFYPRNNLFILKILYDTILYSMVTHPRKSVPPLYLILG
jgi:hypothetical protein